MTPSGRKALESHRTAEGFGPAMAAEYRKWKQSQQVPQRRAWLLRGSSVLGVNVVPEWLEHDYCSLAGSQLRPI